jgi:hypothetical protein
MARSMPAATNTYFNPQTGREFSAVVGFDCHFKNTDTQCHNGVDFHLACGAPQFLSKQLLVGSRPT